MRERYPPTKAGPSPRSGAALSWRHRPRVKPWWTNSSPKSWGRWTMPHSPTRTTRAVPRVTYNSTNMWLPAPPPSEATPASPARPWSLQGVRCEPPVKQQIVLQSQAAIVSWYLWVTFGSSYSSLHHHPQSPPGTCNFRRRGPVDPQGDLLQKLWWHCHLSWQRQLWSTLKVITGQKPEEFLWPLNH